VVLYVCNFNVQQSFFVISDHTKSVECVAFSSDSRLLCSGSWDKSAVLWNAEVINSVVINQSLDK